MNNIDRRTVLGAGIVGALGTIMPARILAQPALIVRPSLQSPIGKEMVKVYAKAVALMMDKNKYPEGDPRSWTFQWYTHMVRGGTDKASEISRIFPKGGGGRNLAEAMWDTCEAHKDFSREQFFLPWHRLYVQCFEQIVRHVSGRPDFALPYWDYTDQTQRALPKEFRSPNDPILKSLYRKNRWGPINTGAAIDSLPGAGPIDLDALKSLDYLGNVADAGFCANLDGNLHGNVHGNVGNQMGMGSINWAADDPVFWLHHCNIDRIWASWNRQGGRNPNDPDYLNEAFTFADPMGSALSLKVSDAMQMNGYGYDDYEKRPLGFPSLEQGGPTFVSQHGVSKVVAPTVELSSTKRQVRLARPVTSPDGGPLLASISSPAAASRSARFYLKLENILVM